MKKFLVTILAFVYLGISSGIAMNVHYCMGKIFSVKFAESEKKCGKCGMKKGAGKGHNGCCKDELKIVKLSDAHKTILNEVSSGLALAALPANYAGFNPNIIIFTDTFLP